MRDVSYLHSLLDDVIDCYNLNSDLKQIGDVEIKIVQVLQSLGARKAKVT